MREFKNNTARNLTYEEHEAILQAAKFLSSAFKKTVYAVSINANKQEATDVWGVAFCFDLAEHGYR